MARCCYEAYKKKAYLIGRDRLAFTKFSNILHVTYEEKIWEKDTFFEILENFAKEHQESQKKGILLFPLDSHTRQNQKDKNHPQE